MLIRWDSYRIFYQVAKCGSFSRAAGLLFSNQPNVTRAVKNLENDLGCQLFVRSNRGVTMTPEGEKLFVQVEEAAERLREGEEELARDRSLEGGVVSVAATEIALHTVLLETLTQFHRAYPQARIRISSHSTPQAIATLQSGAADLALVVAPTGAAKPLKEYRLRAFRELLVGGPAFRAHQGRKLHLGELQGYPFIGLGRDSTTYEFYRKLFLEQGLVYDPDMVVAATDQILPMVKSGLGLGFLPEAFVREALEAGQAFQIPLEEEIPQRYVVLLKDTRRALGIAAREMEKALLAVGDRAER